MSASLRDRIKLNLGISHERLDDEIDARIGAENIAMLRDWASDSVRWAQDLMKTASGDERRFAVINTLKEIRTECNLNITDDQINVLVRAAYIAMKEAQAEVYVVDASDA